ncbi:glycosyltransferase family 1 protein [Flavobacterium sp. IMCC34518]|uniref:glycosyltransferase family 4 protein n=1 Tax=Flavobacterium sp. IMCC34518 TaxID=3003623 RepID=UPI0022AC1894|nr:glycosyltransferase family 1 protein [Flavobacterium sp. IMCC34518]
MKLVIDIRLINASGIGTYLKNIVPGILDIFDQVIVLGNTKEISRFHWNNRVEIIEFNAKIYSLKEQILYPIVVPKCDIFWAPHFNVPLLPIKAQKIVTTIHDLNHLAGVSPISMVKKKYAELLFQNAVKKANLIFTVSEFSKKELLKYTSVFPNKIKVVYCGVNKYFFQNTINDTDLKLPSNYILYVGNVKPHKNLMILLKAYCLLSKELKSKYQLVIIGKKEGFITRDKQIDNYIKSHNLQHQITFTGYIDDLDLPKIYQEASLFVFPSLYEGFGLPILEALAAGTMVISSNASSLPEIGGEAVIYFDPNDHTELIQKITKYLEKGTDNSFLRSQSEIQLGKFTWEKAIENHIQGFKIIE